LVAAQFLYMGNLCKRFVYRERLEADDPVVRSDEELQLYIHYMKKGLFLDGTCRLFNTCPYVVHRGRIKAVNPLVMRDLCPEYSCL
jgi:hypothetical protein